MDLTETERLAPSARLAELLNTYRDRIGEPASIDEQEQACVSRAVSLAGLALEQAAQDVARAYAALPDDAALMGVRYSLMTANRWLNTGLAEVKDATFLLDGYHADFVQREQEAAEADELLEEQAAMDLDVCGYAGKWKSAQQGVAAERPNLPRAEYWQAVRLYFLELGGCYLSERTSPDAEALVRPLPSWLPEMSAPLAPQKVRFA